jgi:hypothetical protein
MNNNQYLTIQIVDPAPIDPTTVLINKEDLFDIPPVDIEAKDGHFLLCTRSNGPVKGKCFYLASDDINWTIGRDLSYPDTVVLIPTKKKQ